MHSYEIYQSNPTLESIASPLAHNPDFIQRRLVLPGGTAAVWVLYLDSMTDRRMVDQDLILPLISLPEGYDTANLSHDISCGLIPVPSLEAMQDPQEICQSILKGSAVLYVEGGSAFCADAKGYAVRSVTEPPDEEVSKGARDAFVESIQSNMALIRRRLPTQDLTFLPVTIGRRSHTLVYIAYIRGVTPQSLADAVRKKLEAVDVDALFCPGIVEEAVSPSPIHPFPQYIATQRPDRVCLHLCQGGVAVLCDGFSSCTLTPAVLGSFLINMEEYNYNPWFASFIRLMRLAVMALAILTPALYVAAVSFHAELLPAEFALFIQSSKEGVPLSTFQETLVLLFINEMLLEAGMRVPKAVGQTVTIIGGLVVGDAAVNAQILSPVTLVLISLSVMAGLNSVTQDLSHAMRIWRLLLTFAAWLAGLPGILLGLLVLLFSLAKLEVYGIPYLSPSLSVNPRDQGDTLIRLPLSQLTRRWTYYGSPNTRRQA